MPVHKKIFLFKTKELGQIGVSKFDYDIAIGAIQRCEHTREFFSNNAEQLQKNKKSSGTAPPG